MTDVDPSMWRELQPPVDLAVAELALGQHGVVSRAQLRALGLSSRTIDRRISRGRLHLLHRGVYAVGHARVPYRGKLWAAVLARGGPDRATLSHRAAAAGAELMAPPSGPVDVTTSRSCRSTPRIRLHASRLAPQDVVRDEDGLPRTSIARTLLDLGDVLGPHRLERVCHEAELLRVLDANEMAELLARVPGRRTRALRAALATLADASPDVTRSELEERFLELIARARLPRPAVNARVAGFEVDFAWPAQRVIVETDGAAAHRTARAFERDRERDLALTVAGFRVIRLTWRRVTREPDHVAASLRALLAAAPTRPRPLPPPSPRAA